MGRPSIDTFNWSNLTRFQKDFKLCPVPKRRQKLNSLIESWDQVELKNHISIFVNYDLVKLAPNQICLLWLAL